MSYTSISFISSCFVKISSLTLITFPCFTFQPSSHFLFIEGLFALAELNIEQFIFLTQTLNIWKPTREYSEAHLHICAVKEGAHGLKICLIMRSNNQFLGPLLKWYTQLLFLLLAIYGLPDSIAFSSYLYVLPLATLVLHSCCLVHVTYFVSSKLVIY